MLCSNAGSRADAIAEEVPRTRPRGQAASWCDGGTATICPKLAEAQAYEALAEQQLVELNHRMANLLQTVASGIQRQRRMQDAAAARDELDILETRLQAAAALQRRLLEPGRHARVDLGGLIAELACDIAGVTGLVCHVDAEPVSIAGAIATQLAAGVNELAWNAYKHGYRKAPGGVVRLVCRPDGDALLSLSVADRGRGLPPGFDAGASTGLGLSIVRATARRFHGEFRVEQDRETRFTLLLPLARLKWLGR